MNAGRANCCSRLLIKEKNNKFSGNHLVKCMATGRRWWRHKVEQYWSADTINWYLGQRAVVIMSAIYELIILLAILATVTESKGESWLYRSNFRCCRSIGQCDRSAQFNKRLASAFKSVSNGLWRTSVRLRMVSCIFSSNGRWCSQVNSWTLSNRLAAQ